MKFRRQVTNIEGPNITPLIDVVFLLLIFFMVTTTFTKETHLEVNLPEATGEKQALAKDEIEVLIDAQGNYSVNGKLLINNQSDTLQHALEKVAGDSRDMPFVITGDANSSYQAIVTVMDLAGKMGFVNLSMTTRTPDEQ